MDRNELIKELQDFPEICNVFLQCDDGRILKLDSVHAVRVIERDGGGFREAKDTEDAVDLGPLLYG